MAHCRNSLRPIPSRAGHKLPVLPPPLAAGNPEIFVSGLVTLGGVAFLTTAKVALASVRITSLQSRESTA
jgi:hypothetical protein